MQLAFEPDVDRFGAVAVGYLMGTAKGREQRDLLVVKVQERRGGVDLTETPIDGDTIDVTDGDTETAAEPDAAPVS